MERVNFRGSSQLALLAELRERELLAEVGDPLERRRSVRPRRAGSGSILDRVRIGLDELLRPAS